MSKCSKCGVEAKENARYCKACGAPVGGEALNDKKARVMSKEKTWVKPTSSATRTCSKASQKQFATVCSPHGRGTSISYSRPNFISVRHTMTVVAPSSATADPRRHDDGGAAAMARR